MAEEQEALTPEEEAAEVIDLLPVVVKETKAGYKTTEFWVGVVTSLLIVVDGIPLPEKLEGVAVTVIAALYAISRGIAKKGVPSVEEDAAV